MSHWFSGWRLSPDSPKGPVDGAYQQLNWLRPYRPGAPRIVLAGLGVVVFLLPMYSAIIVVLSPTSPLVPRLIIATAFAMIAFGVGTLVARLFATGVYVNDRGIRLVTLRGMLSVPWAEVADVSIASGPTRFLGMPMTRTTSHRVIVTTRDRGPIQTPVTSTGLDFIGRAEAYDAAALAVERWWRDAGGEARGAASVN